MLIVGIDLGNNEGTEIGFWYGKVLVTTLGAMDRFSMGTYYGTELGSTDGTADGRFEVLLLCVPLGSLDGL